MKSSYLKALCLICLSTVLTQSLLAQERRITDRVRNANTARQAAIANGGEPPAPATPPPVPTPSTSASTNTSTKPDPIKDLPTAEKVVKYQLNVVKQAKARDVAAQKSRDALHAAYKDRKLDPTTTAAVEKRNQEADKIVERTTKDLDISKQAFDKLFEKYQKFGGTNDYRAQLPQ